MGTVLRHLVQGADGQFIHHLADTAVDDKSGFAGEGIVFNPQERQGLKHSI